MIAKPVLVAVVIGVGAALLVPKNHEPAPHVASPAKPAGERHATLTWMQEIQMQTIQETMRKIYLANEAGDFSSACAHVGILAESWLALAASLPGDTAEFEEANRNHKQVSKNYRDCSGF